MKHVTPEPLLACRAWCRFARGDKAEQAKALARDRFERADRSFDAGEFSGRHSEEDEQAYRAEQRHTSAIAARFGLTGLELQQALCEYGMETEMRAYRAERA